MKLSKNYINQSWIAMLIFFIVFMIGQYIAINYWNEGIKLIDIFELMIAPACCFSLASLFGFYKNKVLTLVSMPGILLIGNIFYVFFQKLTFFKDSDLISLFITNNKLLGVLFLAEVAAATIVSYVCLNLKNKKQVISP